MDTTDRHIEQGTLYSVEQGGPADLHSLPLGTDVLVVQQNGITGLWTLDNIVDGTVVLLDRTGYKVYRKAFIDNTGMSIV